MERRARSATSRAFCTSPSWSWKAMYWIQRPESLGWPRSSRSKSDVLRGPSLSRSAVMSTLISFLLRLRFLLEPSPSESEAMSFAAAFRESPVQSKPEVARPVEGLAASSSDSSLLSACPIGTPSSSLSMSSTSSRLTSSSMSTSESSSAPRPTPPASTSESSSLASSSSISTSALSLK